MPPEVNCFLCKGVKGRDALPRECKCYFYSMRVSGAEDELCELVGCADDTKMVVQGYVGHDMVGDGLHDDL